MHGLINLWRLLAGALVLQWLTLSFKKQSSSAASTANTTTNIDKRLVVSEGAAGISLDGSGHSVGVNITDGGSVANALNFALEASRTQNELSALQANNTKAVNLELIDLTRYGGEQQFKTFQEAVGFVSESNKTAAKAYDAATAQAVGAYSTAAEIHTGSRFLVMGGLVVVGIVAFAALKKG